jgi:hypothetical protein
MTASDSVFPNVLEIFFPPDGKRRLPKALQEFGLDSEYQGFRRLHDALCALESMPPAAMVAVLGSLNGGKSSCLSCFLSESGWARVACGNGSEKGTHRFVFWLPQRWDDRQAGGIIWPSIESRLASALGSGVEFLSNDPEAARIQTNGGGNIVDNFHLPLIAFDAKLDALDLCLVDCPDVESKVDGQHARDRLEIVRRIAPMLQGVLFVAHSTQLRSEVIQDLAGIFGSDAPSISRFLLVNKLRLGERSIVEQFNSKDLLQLKTQFQPRRVFGAYDFEVISNQASLPHSGAETENLPEGLPWFFEVATDNEDKNHAEQIDAKRFLSAHLRNLDPGDLWSEATLEKRRELLQKLDDVRMQLASKLSDEMGKVLRVRSDLIQFIRQQMTDLSGALKIPFTQELLRELAASIERMAPFYVKPTFKLRNVGAGAVELIKNAREGFTKTWKRITDPSNELKTEIGRMGEVLRQQRRHAVFSPEDFAVMMSKAGVNDSGIPEEQLVAGWKEILKSLEEVVQQMPDEQVDAISQEIWKSIPIFKKVILVLSAPVLLLGGLATACLALVDMGVSAVIFSASMVNLTGMLGLGIAGAAGGAFLVAKFDDMLRRYVAVPSYQRMVAAAVDVFGLPRQPEGPLQESFANTGKLTLDLSQETERPCMVRLTTSRMAREIPEGWEQLRAEIEKTC